MSQGDPAGDAGDDRPTERTTCGLAIASLVFGILGVICFAVLTGIPAFILGFLALGKIRESRGLLTGKGLALTGMVLGGLSLPAIDWIPGFLLPTLLRGRAYQVECGSHLHGIYTAAETYRLRGGTGAFPFRPEGSIASLQALVDFDPQRLDPRLFICPEGEEVSAKVGAGGSFTLSPESCSYEIFPQRIRGTHPQQILLYDKAPHHAERGGHGGRTVLFADGSIQYLEEEEFQARLQQSPGKPRATENR